MINGKRTPTSKCAEIDFSDPVIFDLLFFLSAFETVRRTRTNIFLNARMNSLAVINLFLYNGLVCYLVTHIKRTIESKQCESSLSSHNLVHLPSS